jgi:hypothetical protein
MLFLRDGVTRRYQHWILNGCYTCGCVCIRVHISMYVCVAYLTAALSSYPCQHQHTFLRKKWGSYPSRVTSNPRIFITEPLSGFMVNFGVPLNEIFQVSVSLDCALQIVATKMKYYSSLVSRRLIGILLLNLNREIKLNWSLSQTPTPEYVCR